MTASEAAEFLGLTAQDLCYHCAKGNIRAVKVGRHWILRFRDVEHWRPNPPGPRPKGPKRPKRPTGGGANN